MSRGFSTARWIAALGDLVEDHPLDRHLRLQHLEQVPGDRLALAVLVGREVELVGVLQQRLELGDLLLLVGGDDVEGSKSLSTSTPSRPTAPLDLGRDVGGVASGGRGCGRWRTRRRSPAPR
jgi:hypothetical protein